MKQLEIGTPKPKMETVSLIGMIDSATFRLVHRHAGWSPESPIEANSASQCGGLVSLLVSGVTRLPANKPSLSTRKGEA